MTAKTRAQEIAEKARKLAEAKIPSADTTHRPAPAADQPLAKPVRSTLDLPPAVHRDLQHWLNESATRMGRSRLTKQEVLEALVRRLLHDEPLAKLIMADLRENQ
jgi:hypothetical protein